MTNLYRWLIKFNQSKIGELFRYGMAGGSAFLVWIGVLIVLVEWFGVNEIVASAAGFIAATPINYALQKRYVFKSAENIGSRFFVYCVVTVIALGLNTLLFWMMINFTNIHYTLAQIITTGVIVLVNYYVNRTYTFSAGAAT
tara:strand:+ start:433 stop:858 length:426 start_codon:yes stop_codon:yes gene_type:complete